MGAIAYNGEIYRTGKPGDMIGATASADGAHGLVPAPSAGDENKVLKGNGTWGEPSSSGHTILNNQGQAVPARSNLQFGKSIVTDDSTNDITKVNVNNAIEKSYAEFQNLTPTERADGSVYYIPDYPTLGNVFFFRTVDAMQAAIQHGDVPNNAICITTADYPYEAKAEDVTYDNTDSGLEATDLQGAIDDVATALDGKQDALTNPLTQSDVVNNLTSTATNVPLSAAMGKSLKDTINGFLSHTVRLYDGNISLGGSITLSDNINHYNFYAIVDGNASWELDQKLNYTYGSTTDFTQLIASIVTYNNDAGVMVLSDTRLTSTDGIHYTVTQSAQVNLNASGVAWFSPSVTKPIGIYGYY